MRKKVAAGRRPVARLRARVLENDKRVERLIHDGLLRARRDGRVQARATSGGKWEDCYVSDSTGKRRCRLPGEQKWLSCSRVVLIFFAGRLPGGLDVIHKNRNGLDDRPDNLEYRTRKNWAKNGVDTGFRPRGSKIATAKLTEEKVRDIRMRLANHESETGLAMEYGVGITTIQSIRYWLSWKHVR